MKFKKLRKILPSGQVEIVEEKKDKSDTTIACSKMYNDISTVPNKYDDYKVVSLNVLLTEGIAINVVTIHKKNKKRAKTIKFGDLRKHIPVTEPVCITMKSTDGEYTKYLFITDVPTEYNNMDVVWIKSEIIVTHLDGSIEATCISLDDTK